MSAGAVIATLALAIALSGGGAAIYFAKHGWRHGLARPALRLSIWKLRHRLAIRYDEHRYPALPREED